jgi:NAD(P)-dependent dehydrogenase (short-subunit alcohol dehydrogenase family)
VRSDATRSADVDALVSGVVERFGRLDILVPVPGARHSPRGRLGHPDDIAPVAGFLVSDSAAWVSGQVVRTNGAMF